uniref:Uncharacterized protein n=1 Tax=Leersia perrieri TaxID=77586 RepID=A0A0D9W187_9ORYZ
MESPTSPAASRLDFYDFIGRMRRPAAADLFHSIRRTFGSSVEDVKADMEISEKIGLLQHFVRPHHLDIPTVLRNEGAWLLKSCKRSIPSDHHEISLRAL